MESPSGQSNSSPVAPKKTKAEIVNSEKFIALNQSFNNPSPIPQSSPTSSLINSLTDSYKQELKPTEIIIAKLNSPTPLPTNNYYLLSPTVVKKLPETGNLDNNLIIFLSAVFLIFYSFIF